MAGFKKPSVVLRETEVKVRKAFGMHVPADPRAGYTDKMEILGLGTVIAYKDKGAGSPTAACKAAIAAGAAKAREVIRKANDEVAAVVMLRRKESAAFQQIMATHLHLIAGDDAGGVLKDNVVDKKFSLKAVFEKDRRWVLEKVREKFLSLSFHLNTGVYLVDIDAANRDIRVGEQVNPALANPNEEAFVGFQKGKTDPLTWRTTSWKGLDTGWLAGFKNGEIHAAFDKLENYSVLSYARVIIHEATHKYLGAKDHFYAHDPNYPTLPMIQCLDNADSLAWAAVSLACGAVKMGTPGVNPDWDQCT